MLSGQPTHLAHLLEGTIDEDLSLSQVAPKSLGATKASTKRKYHGLLKEDRPVKWVHKDLRKVPVCKVRFDGSVHHGQARTRDPKVVVLLRENP